MGLLVHEQSDGGSGNYEVLGISKFVFLVYLI